MAVPLACWEQVLQPLLLLQHAQLQQLVQARAAVPSATC